MSIHRYLAAAAAVAALLVCVAGASSASAVTAYDQTTGTALAVGSSVNSVCDRSVSAGSCTLTGTFGGVSQTLVCNRIVSVGQVEANPDTVGNVVGTASSMTFSSCINSTTGQACTVSVSGLPWKPDTNHGGLLATSTTTGLAGTGSGSITISSCLGGLTCTFQGGTAGPAGSSPYTLTNYVSGPWSNTAPQIHIGGTPNVTTSPSVCGPLATWTADFTVRTGSTAGSGDLVGLR